ncbi:hypothetical protein, partial [Brevundimonas faecalis]
SCSRTQNSQSPVAQSSGAFCCLRLTQRQQRRRVRFERVQARPAYYLELEDVVKFAVHDHLENVQGFSSLPGFRKSQPRVMLPWVVINEGYRFNGRMPRRILYPSIGIEF